MSNGRDFFKNSSFMLSSQMLTMVVGLLSQMAMARLLMPDGRGLFALCVVCSSFAILFTNFGNEFGIRFLFVTKKINTFEAFVFNILTSILALILVCSFIFFIRDSFSIGHIDRITDIQFYLGVLFVVTNLISRQFNVLLTLNKQFKIAALTSIVEEISKLILLYLFLTKTEATVENALISNISVSLLVIVHYIINNYNIGFDVRKINFANIGFIYKYGFKSFFFNLSNLANGSVSTIILSFYLTNDKIGIYTVAYGLILRLQFIPDTFNRILVPSLVDKSDKMESIKLYMSSLFYLFLVVSIFLLFFSEYIIKILFGNEYLESALLLKIISIGFTFKMLCKPIESYYNEVKGKPLMISIVNFINIIILIFSLNYFTKKFGLIGAGVAISLVMLVSFIILFSLFIRIENQKILTFFSFRKIIKTLNRFRVKQLNT